MSSKSRTRQGFAVLLPVLASAMAADLAAADNLIPVEWTNAEITDFVKEQASRPRSLGPAADDKLSKLKLPVLAFEQAPGMVENTFRLGPKPATEREVVTDEENPVWYQIVEHYGDVTVSVGADLRVQHAFPSSYPVYTDSTRGAAAQAGPVVSVFDERNEGSEEGLIAEYTIMKYGVPYTVTIECSREAREQCRDTSQISSDSAALKLVSAKPPKP